MSSSYCWHLSQAAKMLFLCLCFCPFQKHSPYLWTCHEAFLRKNLISWGPRNGGFSEFELFVSLFQGSVRKCHGTSCHSETCSSQCQPYSGKLHAPICCCFHRFASFCSRLLVTLTTNLCNSVINGSIEKVLRL